MKFSQEGSCFKYFNVAEQKANTSKNVKRQILAKILFLRNFLAIVFRIMTKHCLFMALIEF